MRDIETYDFLTTDDNMLQKGDGDEPQGKRARVDVDVEGAEEESLGESDHDFWLPLSIIKRVAKAKLNETTGPETKVNLEAMACVAVARAATIYISVLTAAALDTCGKRSTLMTENIFQGIAEMEFDGFGTQLLAMQEDAKRATPAKAEVDAPPKKKKPLSGFFKFSMEKRAQVKEDNPEASVSECAKILGKLWRGLTDEQRAGYKDTGGAADSPDGAAASTPAASSTSSAADPLSLGGIAEGEGLEDDNARKLADAADSADSAPAASEVPLEDAAEDSTGGLPDVGVVGGGGDLGEDAVVPMKADEPAAAAEAPAAAGEEQAAGEEPAAAADEQGGAAESTADMEQDAPAAESSSAPADADGAPSDAPAASEAKEDAPAEAATAEEDTAQAMDAAPAEAEQPAADGAGESQAEAAPEESSS